MDTAVTVLGETRSVRPDPRSRAYSAGRPPRSAAVKLALLTNATCRPFGEIAGWTLSALRVLPPEATDTWVVVPATRSRTNALVCVPVVPGGGGTRLPAVEENATRRPSAEIDGVPLPPLACPPPVATDTREVTSVVAAAAGEPVRWRAPASTAATAAAAAPAAAARWRSAAARTAHPSHVRKPQHTAPAAGREGPTGRPIGQRRLPARVSRSDFRRRARRPTLAGVIAEVDDALRALVARDALDGAGVDVVFDAPTKDWSARRNAPTVNMYLYDIREDMRRRERGLINDYDQRGNVVARHLPPRHFRLSYLVTAWTQRPEDEHRLLAALLSCFVRHEAVPDDLVAGPLRLGTPVGLTVALWSALGGELKPSLDLVVSAPIDTGQRYPAAPAVLAPPVVQVAGQGSAAGAVSRRQGRPLRRVQPDGVEGPAGVETPAGVEGPAGADRPAGAVTPAGAERPERARRPDRGR